jgi:hypothetical protein
MEHGLEVILAIFIFVSAMFTFFEVVGLVGELLTYVGSDNDSSVVAVVVVEGALIFIVFVLVVGGDFPGFVGAGGVLARQNLVQHNLSKAHNLHN